MGLATVGNHCVIKAARRDRRVFSERDAGRIVAYARQDGANDAILIANILQAFGLRDIGCQVFRILDVLNTAFFLGAIISIIQGVLTLLKGVKIVITGGKSKIATSLIELIVPNKFKNQLASILIWIGGAQIAGGALIIFITGIANNVAIFLLAKGVCDTEVKPLPIDVPDLDIGDLSDIFDLAEDKLLEILKFTKE
jgi:hypothetical protein